MGMSKEIIKTTLDQICEYWLDNIPVEEIYLNFDWCDCKDRCWNCAKSFKYSKPDRCHIIPKSLGGLDTPSNFVILCKECHQTSPDTIYPDDMWDWIKGNKKLVGFYENSYNLDAALKQLCLENNCTLPELCQEYVENTGIEDYDELIKTTKTDLNKLAKGMGCHWGISTPKSTLYFIMKRFFSGSVNNESKIGDVGHNFLFDI